MRYRLRVAAVATSHHDHDGTCEATTLSDTFTSTLSILSIFLVSGETAERQKRLHVVLLGTQLRVPPSNHFVLNACCSDSYTSASMRASALSSSEPLPPSTL